MLRRSIALLVALVVVSLVAEIGVSQPTVLTGSVVEWEPGQLIAIWPGEQYDRRGLQFVLRDTKWEGDPEAIEPGVRVSVWYKSVQERQRVAVKVRVLASPSKN